MSAVVDIDAPGPGEPACATCGRRLMFSACQRGDGMCGPCSRKANGTQSAADRARERWGEVDVSLDPIVIDVGCGMMLDAFSESERRCGATPTVGQDGLLRRYCERHMRMVAEAGATTLQYDDTRVVDDPDVPSPIDSDAPASVHGGNLVTTRQRARELFGRGSGLGENTPLPFRIVER